MGGICSDSICPIPYSRHKTPLLEIIPPVAGSISGTRNLGVLDLADPPDSTLLKTSDQPSRDLLRQALGYRPPVRLALAESIAFGLLILVVAFSAVVVKELTSRDAAPTLAVIDPAGDLEAPTGPSLGPIVDGLGTAESVVPPPSAVEPVEEASFDENAETIIPERYETDTSIRYFNGRPVRPVRTIMMTVTAYSPDSRSCGDSADGITASLHDVYTNGFRLVAADTRLLPLGSMIKIPGYAGDQIVPVLDRGGKIKGTRLDVLFPTHEIAVRWGVKKLPVTIWQYADGKPADDWRKIRDSK